MTLSPGAKVALKLAVGFVVVAIVASQITLADRVGVVHFGVTEVISGSGLKVSGSVSIGAGSAAVPIERAVVRKRGDLFEVEDLGAPAGAVPVTSPVQPTFAGQATLILADGTPRVFGFDEIAVRHDGGRPERISLDAVPGLLGILKRVGSQPVRAVGAMALLLLMYLAGVLRWELLLKCQGLGVSYWRALKLTFIGFFFNNVLPGLTGGDLVKAVMIAREHPGRRAAAVGTVIVDRVIGLVVLAMISGVVLVADPGRFPEASIAIFGFLGAVLAGTVLLLSRRVRNALGIAKLAQRLPGANTMRKLDEAFRFYRSAPRILIEATLLSVVCHAGNIGAIYLLGLGIGLDRSAGLVGDPLVAYIATVPVTLIVSSIPLIPGGWGVGEFAFAHFFRAAGIRDLDLSVALSVVQRAATLVWSLLGGAFFLADRRHHPGVAPISAAEAAPSSGAV